MILTAQQVAELLDCSLDTVNAEAAAARLPALRMGRSWVFPARALEDALNARAAEHVQRKVAPLATATRPQSRRRAPPALPTLPTAVQPDPRPAGSRT